MSSKEISFISSDGDSGLRLLPWYFGSLMSMQWNVCPSMLFCHCALSGAGHETTSDKIDVQDPKKVFESVKILALGTSEKK